jgi:acetyl esterase/lipase
MIETTEGKANPSPRRLRPWQKILLVLGVTLVALGTAGWTYLHRDNAAASAPRGYGSRQELFLAISVGAVELIDLNPPLPPGVKETDGIEYGRGGGKPLLLDLYEPVHKTGLVPGLIFIHGGAWKGGKREIYRNYCAYFASRGWVTATIDYRLLPEGKAREQVADCKAAVRWMRANAARFGIDPDRLAVLGGSAGGHLSLMIGYTSALSELEGEGGNPGVGSEVAAVVDLYGPTDLTTEEARQIGFVREFMGTDPGKDLTPWKLMSPLFHVSSNCPPTLILHGTIDTTVEVAHGDWLNERLAAAGVPHEYERIDGWPHTMDLARPVNNYFKRRIETFLRQSLRLPPVDLPASGELPAR